MTRSWLGMFSLLVIRRSCAQLQVLLVAPYGSIFAISKQFTESTAPKQRSSISAWVGSAIERPLSAIVTYRRLWQVCEVEFGGRRQRAIEIAPRFAR